MYSILLRPETIGAACIKIQQASETGITTVKSSEQHDVAIPRPHKTIFRWGTTAQAINHDRDTTFVNTTKAITWCINKRQARLGMQEAGVSVPATWGDLIGFIRDNRAVPADKTFVVRPLEHTKGENYFVGTAMEAAAHLSDIGSGYISDHINKVAEFRVNVVQGRVAQVGNKVLTNTEQTNWGGTNDRFNNVRWGQWNMAVVNAAVAAAIAGGLDFCGVDVMLDSDGKAYVLECNSAPWLNDYSGQCMAWCFDYIVNNGKEPFPAMTFNTWEDAIHPAMTAD